MPYPTAKPKAVSTNPAVQPLLIDIRELSIVLGGYSCKTIRNNVAAGIFPIRPVKLGGRVFFRVSDVHAFVNAAIDAPAPAAVDPTPPAQSKRGRGRPRKLAMPAPTETETSAETK